MSIYLGNQVIAAGGSSAFKNSNIGEIIQSTVPLVDAGLHLLDGSIIQRGSYTAFVDYIAGLVSSYPDLFTTENDWQSSVLSYGVCGKFVYNSTNQTVRLPKITGIIEGTTDLTTLGDLVEAGLPDVSHKHIDGFAGANATSAYGVSSTTTVGNKNQQNGTSTDYHAYTSTVSLSDINSIYGNSDTVQPQSIKTLYYIVIATTTKTNIQVDIDQITTDLNAKADKSEFGDLDIVHVIVETYVNGTAWYRLYDDGWVEQGDYLAWSGAWTTVNLLKNFMNTNYTVLGGGARTDSSPYQATFNFKDYTTSSFSIWSSDDSSSNPAACKWYACGYGE